VRRSALLHRVEYGFFLLVFLLVRALPERLALALGAGLGWGVGGLIRIRRGVVDENLQRAFPEESDAWRERVGTEAYRHLGRQIVALLLLEGAPATELAERTEVEGEELLRRALAGGRGAILLTGHLGNWEVAGARIAAMGVPVDAVARRLANPYLDRRMRETRARSGMVVIDKGGATRPALRALSEGRAIALVADQNVSSGGLFVDFFGVPAATARGPGLLATRTGAPVFFVTCTTLPPGARYRVRIEPMELPELPDEGAARWVTERYSERLEAAIRERPEEYFWFHRRWKTEPEATEDRLEGTPSAGEGTSIEGDRG